MLFNSFDFLLFFTLVFGIQLALPHRPRNVFLVLASYFFYACWDWRFAGLMLATTVVDYTVSHAIFRTGVATRRRRLVAVSVLFNLGILAYFKYVNFFADSMQRVLGGLGVEVQPWHLGVILPVGISFYTFQAMSYTIDVYRGRLRPLDRFIDFALYVSLFPQLVAGPIERGEHLAPQVTRKRISSWTDVQDGSWLILKGLFKKAVIADNLAPIVDAVFSQPSWTGPQVLIGVYAFAFQIYCDFSGYTDMARGLAKLLGYDLMLNFRLPYFAIDPSDFWRRWHISLSSWLRDYLYIPLGGGRGGLKATSRNLMVTMLLGGLWHGAAWTYVVWGLYHGALLVAFRVFRRLSAVSAAPRCPVGSTQWVMSVVVMFHLTCLGWLLFRATSLTQAGAMFASLTGPWTLAPRDLENVWQLVVLCGPLVLVQLAQEAAGNLNLIGSLSILPRSVAYAAIVIAVLTLGHFGGREFIYFQF